jgi:hypothetical protein
MGLAERSARRQPLDLLSGDRGDPVVLLVVVQDGNAGGLGRGCDQEIGVTHRAVVQSALVGELLVDQTSRARCHSWVAIGQLGGASSVKFGA